MRTLKMRRLSSALLTATLLAGSAVGCSDDDGNDDKNVPDSGNRPDGGGGNQIDGGGTLLDAGLDATTPTGDASTGTSAVEAVNSAAAEVRVNVNLLLGEHLIIAAKATGAALLGAPQADEYAAYGALLTTNGADLGALVGQAFGEPAKVSFLDIWNRHNGYFVDYTVGVATNDTVKKDLAVSNLTTKYVPEFTALVASATGLPATAVQSLVTEHVLSTKAIVDAQGAKDWTKAYAAIRTAFAHMHLLGDPLAKAAATKLNLSGDIEAKSVTFRVTLNQLLQEHSYLASFATGAAIQGRMDEFTAANVALGANGTDMGAAINGLYGADVAAQFNGIWAAHNGFFVNYTLGVAGNDAAKKQAAVSDLTTKYVPQFSALLEAATGVPAAQWSDGVAMHVTMTAAIVDAQFLLQSAKSAANATSVVTKDRDGAKHMSQLGNPLSKAIVAKIPTKF